MSFGIVLPPFEHTFHLNSVPFHIEIVPNVMNETVKCNVCVIEVAHMTVCVFIQAGGSDTVRGSLHCFA